MDDIIFEESLPPASFKSAAYNYFLRDVTACIEQSANVHRQSPELQIDMDKIRQQGWAGAGIWFNKIAQMNGSLAAAVHAVPRPTRYPDIMEYTLGEKKQQDDNINPRMRFCPDIEAGRDIRYQNASDEDIAKALCMIQQYWEDDGYRVDSRSSHGRQISNAFIDAINAVLGTQGLFDMCKNVDIHPLAQLAMAGKSLVESSMRNLGFSVASGAAGGLAYIFNPHVGAVGEAASGLLMSVAGAGLLIGFILFYVIPLMPFLYFFFAVGGWVKGLFEAMVGIPLWALAHIRIDGEGLPGQAASAGYFLILEIFLRPIMIVLGLIAAILSFTAMVWVLNDIFFLVVSNLAGFNAEHARVCGINNATDINAISTIEYFRGPIDEFFFTIVYALIVYLIGMSCFKLIDTIPNSILRWMNFTLPTFNDERNESADSLVQKVAVGGGAIGGKMGQAGEQLGEALSQGSQAGEIAMRQQSVEDKYG